MNHTFRLARSKRKRLPEGWDLIEPTLMEFDERMREAVNETHEGKRRNEATWGITRIHWERNRFIYELYYKKKAISRELYDYLVKAKLADQNLIAKWRKPGYEFLCSLQAISVRDTNFGTVQQCRVPLKLRNPNQWGPSVKTGCISCASCDKGAPIWWFHTGWREHFEEERRKHLNKGKKRQAGQDDEEEDIRGESAIEERIKRLKQLQEKEKEKPSDPLLQHDEEGEQGGTQQEAGDAGTSSQGELKGK